VCVCVCVCVCSCVCVCVRACVPALRLQDIRAQVGNGTGTGTGVRNCPLVKSTRSTQRNWRRKMVLTVPARRADAARAQVVQAQAARAQVSVDFSLDNVKRPLTGQITSTRKKGWWTVNARTHARTIFLRQGPLSSCPLMKSTRSTQGKWHREMVLACACMSCRHSAGTRTHARTIFLCQVPLSSSCRPHQRTVPYFFRSTDMVSSLPEHRKISHIFLC
jgi:hypothetical protein